METAVAKQQNFIIFFQEFLRKVCQLQTRIFQLLIGQIEKFWCLSDREFLEFFKTHPTFVPSHSHCFDTEQNKLRLSHNLPTTLYCFFVYLCICQLIARVFLHSNFLKVIFLKWVCKKITYKIADLEIYLRLMIERVD